MEDRCGRARNTVDTSDRFVTFSTLVFSLQPSLGKAYKDTIAVVIISPFFYSFFLIVSILFGYLISRYLMEKVSIKKEVDDDLGAKGLCSIFFKHFKKLQKRSCGNFDIFFSSH